MVFVVELIIETSKTETAWMKGSELWESIWTPVTLYAWRTHIWNSPHGWLHTLMNTNTPALLCSWPRTCRRSAACLNCVMLWSNLWGGFLMKASTLVPNMRPSAHTRTTEPNISMSGSSAGPLWGGQMWCLDRCVGPRPKGLTPLCPSGGPGLPRTGRDGASCG